MTVATRRQSILAAAGVVLLFAFALWQGRTVKYPQGAHVYPEISASLEPLRADFNRDAGHVRLIMLIDPT